jgi:putative ABC transport system permease protein
MFKNHLKIAWRNLIKDRQFTFLNVLGLSVGIACTLLIFLWVQDEWSYDRFNEKDSQLFQLMEHRRSAQGVGISDESSGLLGATLAKQMPEVEYAAAVAPPEWWQRFTLSVTDAAGAGATPGAATAPGAATTEKDIKAVGQYVGKDYFNIFSFKLLEGKKDQVLSDKNNIVLSDEMAIKLFGTTENVIGKRVRFQQDRDFAVSGIFEHVPVHSSQQFDFVLSFDYLKDVQSWVNTWQNTGPHNFVMLKPGTDTALFNKKIAAVITQNCGDTGRSAFVMRFSDNYLRNSFSHGARSGGDRITTVRMFSLIAVFILAIACINFMNLSTAKASRRMKEVGIKKVVGAGRRQLVFQFLTESLMVTVIAVLLAVGLCWLLLPAFNQLTGKQMILSIDRNLGWALIAITLFTGLLSGSYPALFLSSFKPISILKGKLPSSFAEMSARKGLVVFQFTLSVILIVSVLIVYQQIQYIRTTDPGYQKDNVIRFSSEGKIIGNEETFITGLKRIPGVINAAHTFNNMVGRNYGDYGVDWDGKDPRESVYFEGFGGGYGLIETMGMQMAAGRSFSQSFGSDSNKIILNEAAIRVMHLQDPVGKNVRLFGQPRQIVGVVKDFHFESLHETVKPSYMFLNTAGSTWIKIMVRIRAGQEKATIDRIQQYYLAFNPGFPFDFAFLDEAYEKQYTSDVRVAILSRYFAGLAILISCLGLFGLATFTAQRRQKEIGIRKVVGASVSTIVVLLSRDFLRLIGIALVIAFPVAWWGMHQWLQGFAYRVGIGPGVFIVTAASIIVITLLTISFQAIRAALMNPVTSLKSE